MNANQPIRGQESLYKLYNSTYPKVNYFSKIEDHIILENGKFEFLKLILSLQTMINRIFFF